MAEDREADSPDESASAARPDDESVENDGQTGDGPDEHVAPEDAREPTVEELEQLLESDEADAPKASLHNVDARRDDDPDGTDGTGADPDDESDSGTDSDQELVSVGAASKTSAKTSAKAGKTGDAAEVATSPAKKARSKKDKATAKQKQPVEKVKRTTPVSFTKEAVGELRKVVYPTASQLGNYFVVVLVFVLIIIGFVSLLDLGFGWVIVRVFS